MKFKSCMSVIAALVIAASMAVSAGAADYSADPSYPMPPSPAGSYGSGGGSKPAAPSVKAPLPSAGTDASNPISVIDKAAVSKALRANAPIYASYEDAAIKANAFALLAKREDSVLKVITKRYTAVIKGESVTKAKDVSLAVKMTKNTKLGAMILRTQQQGEFGCTVDIIISSKYYAQCGVDLNDAHVYFVDENKKVNDLGPIVTDNDGNIVVSMTAGGKFIIM